METYPGAPGLKIGGGGPGHHETPQQHFIGRLQGRQGPLNPGRGPLHDGLPVEEFRSPAQDLAGRISQVEPFDRHAPDLPDQNEFLIAGFQGQGFLRSAYQYRVTHPQGKKQRRTGKSPENIHHHGDAPGRLGPLQQAGTEHVHRGPLQLSVPAGYTGWSMVRIS